MPTTEERLARIEKVVDERLIRLPKFVAENKKPEIGQRFWWIDAINEIYSNVWDSDSADKNFLKAGNFFFTKSEAYDEILRRESMANRIDKPEIGDMIWCWEWVFKGKQACAHYNKSLFLDWYIGCVFTSEGACEAWGEKYSKAFERSK